MLDKGKFEEFFDGGTVDTEVCIVGLGATGSHVAEMAVRLGFKSFRIYDFDVVDAHNLANQNYSQEDIGKEKIDACKEMMLRINPDITIKEYRKGIEMPYTVTGIVFLCIDNIELRKEIVEYNRNNFEVSCFVDFRILLTTAQHYFADREDKDGVDFLLSTMEFTREEAKAATAVSACGMELSVIYTVKAIAAFGIANLVKFLQTKKYTKLMVIDMAAPGIVKM